jgi:hypothetical protein
MQRVIAMNKLKSGLPDFSAMLIYSLHIPYDTFRTLYNHIVALTIPCTVQYTSHFPFLGFLAARHSPCRLYVRHLHKEKQQFEFG